jgi:hypothetical protein
VSPAFTTAQVIERVEILKRKLDEDGWHVQVNTCNLVLDALERLEHAEKAINAVSLRYRHKE